MRGLLIALMLALSPTAHAAPAPEDGFYLYWNRDHTERAPRPVYPLSDAEAKLMDSYHLDYEDGRLVAVRFFHDGKPSPHGDYGAHMLVRETTGDAIVESYCDTAGARVVNASGVWEVRYDGSAQGYWTKKTTLGPDGLPVDVAGYATLEVTRDEVGRRIHEVRYDASGKAVAEHNGFATATFGFDENDFAIFRQNRGPDGSLVNGTNGFAEVRFRFDENGNFLSEQVFDAAGGPKNFPAGYADIRFSNFDRFGRPHRIDLKTETGEPFANMPVVRRSYLPSGLRAGQRYFLTDGTPGMDGTGAHEMRFIYDDTGKRTGASRFDVKGAEIRVE